MATGPFTFSKPNWDVERRETTIMEVHERAEMDFNELTLQFALAFGEVEIVGRQPAVPILNQIAGMCQQIVNVFEALMGRG